MTPGEKVRRKRKNAERSAAVAAEMAILREQSASCATCIHSRRPYWETAGIKGKLLCQFHSDFYGSSHVSPDHLCTDWKEKP